MRNLNRLSIDFSWGLALCDWKLRFLCASFYARLRFLCDSFYSRLRFNCASLSTPLRRMASRGLGPIGIRFVRCLRAILPGIAGSIGSTPCPGKAGREQRFQTIRTFIRTLCPDSTQKRGGFGLCGPESGIAVVRGLQRTIVPTSAKWFSRQARPWQAFRSPPRSPATR